MCLPSTTARSGRPSEGSLRARPSCSTPAKRSSGAAASPKLFAPASGTGFGPPSSGGAAMLIEHQGSRPRIHPSAYVAPTAVLCGDVRIGEGSGVLFGAVLAAEGGPVEVGRSCIVMENAVIRGSKRHSVTIGDHVLIGPRAYL